MNYITLALALLLTQTSEQSQDPEQSRDPKNAKFKCVRVYLNGSMQRSYWDGDSIDDWIEYNKGYRSGTALFVNGACVARGYLSEETCRKYESQFKIELGL